MFRRFLPILGTALLVALPSAAQAAEVSVSGNTAIVTGGAEVNDINVKDAVPGIRIRDAAGIAVGPGCQHVDPNEAICGDDSTTVLQADLGAGDDVLRADPISVSFGIGAEGGPGDDALEGGDQSDTTDVISGGPGNDTLQLADVQNGGDDDDQLRGSQHNDELHGDAGDDAIDGQAGNDVVDGGSGRDSLSGDTPGSRFGGNDELRARDGERDQISCSIGTDTVIADQLDATAADCEQVDREAAFELSAPRSIKLKTLLGSGMQAQLELPSSGEVLVALVVPASTARKLGVGRKQTVLGGVEAKATGGLTLVRLRVASKYRRKLARARSFKLLVYAEFGGESVTVGVSVKR